MRNLKLLRIIGVMGIIGVIGVRSVRAEELVIEPLGVTQIPNLGNFISAGIGAIFLIAFLVFLAMLVWGGIQWITSGGDKENTQKARDRITHALVGVTIMASVWAVTRAVEWFFCINVWGNIQFPSAVSGRSVPVSGCRVPMLP